MKEKEFFKKFNSLITNLRIKYENQDLKPIIDSFIKIQTEALHSGDLQKSLQGSLSTNEFDEIFETFNIIGLDFVELGSVSWLDGELYSWRFTISTKNKRSLDIFMNYLEQYSPEFKPKALTFKSTYEIILVNKIKSL